MPGSEHLPRLAGERTNLLEPVRIELIATILLKEIVARDLAGFRQPQKLPFHPRQPLVELLELHHQLFDAIVVELDLLNFRHQLLAQLLVVALVARADLLARGHRLQAARLHFVQLLVERLDFLEVREHLRLQFFLERRQRQAGAFALFVIVIRARLELRGLGRRLRRCRSRRTVIGRGHRRRRLGATLRRLQIDDVAQQHAPGLQRVVPGDDGAERQWALAQPADHHVAAGLDALGDRNFALARQQLDAAHLAQVHAHRVVGAAEAFLVDVAGLLFGFVLDFFGFRRRRLALFRFLALDDLDPHLGEAGHHVLDLLGAGLLRREHHVQLVEGDVAALLAARDQPLHGGGLAVEQRGVGVLFGRDGVGRYGGLRRH